MFYVTTGYDVEIPCELKKKGLTFAISGAGTAKAVITKADRDTPISEVVDVDMSVVGTDLANSLIIPKFTAAQTELMRDNIGDAILEIQLDDGGKKLPWTEEVRIRIGNIA